jgi:hypothetical protein
VDSSVNNYLILALVSCPKKTRPFPRKRIKGIIPFSLYAQKPKAQHRVVLRLQ